MGKGFLNSKTDSKKLSVMIVVGGFLVSVLMGVQSVRETKLETAYELPKKPGLEAEYEEALIAEINQQKVPVTVTVPEKIFSKEEAEEELLRAEQLLTEQLKGENEDLSKVVTDLQFADQVEDTSVEVLWIEKAADYFYSDGALREDLEIFEAVELRLSAMLVCQEYTRDYAVTITLQPLKAGLEKQMMTLIENENLEHPQNDALILPKEYEGAPITWKKPLDNTFLYFFALTIGTVIFLKVGGKRDEEEAKKERLEELEKDYAQIVSKFAMLLSAGLSVRNAWERIVLMYRRKGDQDSAIYKELNWGLKEMQKGVSEIEVYEKFGIQIGHLHYKKLMSLFISDKKRGSIHLLDAMNQEMMQAWDEQKRKTRQQGEKIGTKLLVPMMGMLGVVFIMILVPAFLSFQL